jgi:predicted RecA/RadA family phage recombinase
MKTFRQKGDVLGVVAPTGGYSSNEVVPFGAATTGFIGVARNTIPAGERGPVEIEGVHELPAETGGGTDAAVGTPVSYIIATGMISKDAAATGKHRAGVIARAKATGDTTAWVKLHGN